MFAPLPAFGPLRDPGAPMKKMSSLRRLLLALAVSCLLHAVAVFLPYLGAGTGASLPAPHGDAPQGLAATLALELPSEFAGEAAAEPAERERRADAPAGRDDAYRSSLRRCAQATALSQACGKMIPNRTGRGRGMAHSSGSQWTAGRGMLAPGLMALALFVTPGYAAEVTLVGLIGSKAIVVIDAGAPRTLAPGQKTAEGVVLLGTEKDAASFEIDGRKRTLRMGQAYSAAARGGRQTVTIKADARGHFVATGSINGGSVRFLIDTGATLVVLPAAEARRLGIDYLQGVRGRIQTANGVAAAWRVKLDTLRIGDIEVNNVEAVVNENDALGLVLLGMSFLNRMQMQRDDQSMTLTKRY